MKFDKKFKRELKKFLEEISIRMAERDILNPEMPIDVVLARNYECPSPEIREKIRAAVVDWREKGKVNWKQKV